MSVRQSENLVNLYKKPIKIKLISKDSNLKELEKILINKLGIRFLLKIKNNSGSILFNYKDLDQLNKLIYIIKANY